MSFCRWSSMNYMCDLYCYADVSGGYKTHVAGLRPTRAPVDDGPAQLAMIRSYQHKNDDPLSYVMDINWYMYMHRAQLDELKDIPKMKIGLPHDGESFNDPDLTSFLERVRYLREVGYNIPPWLESDILEEMNELSGSV